MWGWVAGKGQTYEAVWGLRPGIIGRIGVAPGGDFSCCGSSRGGEAWAPSAGGERSDRWRLVLALGVAVGFYDPLDQGVADDVLGVQSAAADTRHALQAVVGVDEP